MAASPIADLTYRNYDGPLEPPVNRWWAIAKMSISLSTKKKGFWVWSSCTCAWYLILLAIFYFFDQSSQAGAALGQPNQFFKSIVWKDQFLNAFSVSQLYFFILALLLGAGTIANDNRANALLVYLSKPCSKLDYVIGKWLGIFVPMTLVAGVPTLVFYVYCLLSFRSYGFLTQDGWLIVRLLGMILIPGFFHASASLGISSMFNQGRLAGATYAGFYFFGWFFTKMMWVIFVATNVNNMTGEGSAAPPVVRGLYYASVDGLQIAMAKIILHTDGSALFPFQGAGGGMQQLRIVPQPNTLFFLSAYFGICALFVLLAWSRIRAVEVVG